MIIETKDGKKFDVEEHQEIKEVENRVIINGWDLTECEKWYDNKYCLKAVKQNYYALRYVDKRVFKPEVEKNE